MWTLLQCVNPPVTGSAAVKAALMWLVKMLGQFLDEVIFSTCVFCEMRENVGIWKV